MKISKLEEQIRILEKNLNLLETQNLERVSAKILIENCANILPYLENDLFDKYYKRFKIVQGKYK